ncbi:unknown [Bacteroides sp. CAG:633]|nr:unknown [Bacteroides sp. CAG:633]
MKLMPFTPFRIFRACTRPEVCEEGRSICVISPVTIILVFMPIRVRNILIWAVVVFCASSRMTTASFSVRPRMKANGAICMMFSSMYSFSLAAGIMSCRASYSGCRYGSILSFMSPGRKPSFSPASTAGRLRMIFLISLFFRARTARAMAV